MANDNFGIVKDDSIAIDTFILPVDKEELRLIKLALFEISEYLGSPKLATLRQRVHSIMNVKVVKLPEDSVFNAEEFRNFTPCISGGEIISIALTKEPV